MKGINYKMNANTKRVPNPSCLYKKILAGNLYCSPSPPHFVAEIRRISITFFPPLGHLEFWWRCGDFGWILDKSRYQGHECAAVSAARQRAPIFLAQSGPTVVNHSDVLPVNTSPGSLTESSLSFWKKTRPSIMLVASTPLCIIYSPSFRDFQNHSCHHYSSKLRWLSWFSVFAGTPHVKLFVASAHFS